MTLRKNRETYDATEDSIVGCVAGQVVPAADVGSLLVLDGLQLGAVGDPVTEPTTVAAPSLVCT